MSNSVEERITGNIDIVKRVIYVCIALHPDATVCKYTVRNMKTVQLRREGRAGLDCVMLSRESGHSQIAVGDRNIFTNIFYQHRTIRRRETSVLNGEVFERN